MMVKQSILFVSFSIIAIFFKLQLAKLWQEIMLLNNKLSSGLTLIFSSDQTGRIVQSVVILIVIPLIVGGIVALVFWLLKRSAMPHIMTTIWLTWTVLLVSMLAKIA